MNIKKGDKVKILTGKDKGKTGKVLQVFPSRNRISVEGLNLLIKHMRPRRQGEKGQRIEFPAPMDASNMILLCPKCSHASRIEQKIVKNERGKSKKYRVCKKCKQVID
ncbi:50S ribosomal protein L24 [Candidatus Falkowbacteria bacterium RIFOXYB2_FULL_34_18]|uniref:Large ribosomal subunit protein uL24 n=1 Tax=Candidatus Falkowbacteria bacterium RIFOXYD2_FULL_34_120 TaxID=1798007 RepID=A0A1F5TSQ9_9BACT|nr:MAG: 50S ribosomal protein L24 [Candidatus Falkowbacteria bacterium RIFOXYB2_FULL_34_18]OGF30059.1 MAG: 50S ribosomal protein L24 [Candidatus Falkowbacteria bacterium RIFOXYC12_FULL_34_55]OGF37608.1 MAG: 50S ribosomal protein L24 [Candidatus Falkowbacteria bacterium RIFOXYC2_FULL_34_220]OGF39363.1 MAG: 50S ribosomal protein L24 [Candidatus Falkowbacteria bacterium RIFOXYD12_FULL_34_57]OGF41868.1 MAG: 50S ribosomal protein L24 [Candidatus Falkowbacteria bacterium RIFOXYD2_FULL_34_120]